MDWLLLLLLLPPVPIVLFFLPSSNLQITLDILNFLVLLLNGKIFTCNWLKYLAWSRHQSRTGP